MASSYKCPEAKAYTYPGHTQAVQVCYICVMGAKFPPAHLDQGSKKVTLKYDLAILHAGGPEHILFEKGKIMSTKYSPRGLKTGSDVRRLPHSILCLTMPLLLHDRFLLSHLTQPII